MTFHDAVRAAITEGWRRLIHDDRVDFMLDHLDDPIKGGYVLGSEWDGNREQAVPLAEMFLDPSFWRALGVALGWGDDQWRYHWHRFLDHLGDGLTVMEFFRSLSGRRAE